MPRASQIIPEHRFNHQYVVINDNSEITATPTADSGETRMLFVFASPHGRDGVIQTIDTGLGGFLEEYGSGPFSVYGQPYLNAYAAFGSGAITGHCLRVSAANAAYSNLVIVAKYKVTDSAMSVKFAVKNATAPLVDLDNLNDSYTSPTEADADGYTEVKLFSLAYLGKGSWGDNVCVRVTSSAGADKENNYKNYLFQVYVNENGLVQKEEFAVVFVPDVLISGIPADAESVVNDPDTGSNIVKMVCNYDGFQAIYDAYKAANADTTLTIDNFDVLLGIDKTTKQAITNYTIDTTSADIAVLNDLAGIALSGGDDGDLGASKTAAEREAALTAAYTQAFSGLIDPMIKSKNKYPTNLMLDANYPVEVKKLLATLATARGDCVCIIDCGTGITTKEKMLNYVKTDLDSYITNRVQAIDAYAMKVKDPYTGKIVTVTSTYWLASRYPAHFQTYDNAKHIPLAGNSYGIINGYIKDSIYPLLDEDVDADMMDELTDMHVNYARVNARQDIIRSNQTTRQLKDSKLSELSNVFVLLDIKRDCEVLCATYDYNFAEAADMARFNASAQRIADKYAAAQVRSIGASFGQNAWEAERGILHLYVEFVAKNLVKTTIIEIDVNK